MIADCWGMVGQLQTDPAQAAGAVCLPMRFNTSCEAARKMRDMRMIDRQIVIESYRKVLGRDPENDKVVEEHIMAHQTAFALEQSLLNSPEFKSINKINCSKFNNVITPEELDAFVAASDGIGLPSSTEVEEFWRGKTYKTNVTVDEDLDPFTEEYLKQQIAVYKEISGREIDQDTNENTEFAFDLHAAGANPYAYVPPHGVAIHMGRIARVLERAKLPQGAHVADLGCGWGATSELMAFAGLCVTGIDINPQFVALVNARAKRSGQPISALLGTFSQIPGDSTFDAALFYESLHHAIAPWEALSAAHDRLADGGKLLLAGEPVNNMWKHWGLRTDPLSVYCVRKFGWFESGWSAAFLRTCIERCGFTVEHFADEGDTIGWVVVAKKTSPQP